jgi:hypothetical protein
MENDRAKNSMVKTSNVGIINIALAFPFKGRKIF